MLDSQGFGQAEQKSSLQMSASSLMFVASKYDVIIVQSGWSAQEIKSFTCTPTHRMSKYLALLALPPPLKKLRAIVKLPAAAIGQP